MKSEQIKQITSKAIEQLIAALNEGSSETLTAYLRAMAKFRYSLRNVMLRNVGTHRTAKDPGYARMKPRGFLRRWFAASSPPCFLAFLLLRFFLRCATRHGHESVGSLCYDCFVGA